LRDTWTNGVLGPMNGLANILTSKRVTVDVARQVRLWSGTLRDDKDFEESVQEILTFYTPPDDPTKEKTESTEFLGTINYHSATQNAAFSMNMPQFDVRNRLKDIKVRSCVQQKTQRLTDSGPHAGRRRSPRLCHASVL
jgi:proline iminopeptidase